MHSIATMAEQLAAAPGTRGLITRQRRISDQARVRRLQRHPAARRIPWPTSGTWWTANRPAPGTPTSPVSDAGVVDRVIRPGRPAGQGVPGGAHPAEARALAVITDPDGAGADRKSADPAGAKGPVQPDGSAELI